MHRGEGPANVSPFQQFRAADDYFEPPAQLKARERRRFNRGETARQRQREAYKYQN
jgi:hypothetical protein